MFKDEAEPSTEPYVAVTWQSEPPTRLTLTVSVPLASIAVYEVNSNWSVPALAASSLVIVIVEKRLASMGMPFRPASQVWPLARFRQAALVMLTWKASSFS